MFDSKFDKEPVGGMWPIDVMGSLIRGSLLAFLIIAFLLIVYFYQKVGFGGFLDGLSSSFRSGFGWFK